jgi:hypothetical protein
MPAIREHDIYPNDVEDDGEFPLAIMFNVIMLMLMNADGMPPLVDNPNTSMSFTFFTDMTPITAFSADPTAVCENAWDNPASTSPVDFTDSPDYPATQTPDRVSHGKKRDASYIPRPPNAFILFRSSFIRSQQVPEKVEGNHSTLSKIIGLSVANGICSLLTCLHLGKYWKTLPREEREVWEAKALVAQAEHRKRYPDWRFRPGANALAKLKVKDGPGIANRRRSTQSTKKGRGNAESKKKNKSKDERCSMIADLLVEGKKGAELESALRNWENGISREVEVGKVAVGKEGKRDHEGSDEGNWVEAFPTTNHFQMESVQFSQGLYHPGHVTKVNTDDCDHSATSQPRCKTPHDDRFKVPLTTMFKRSLSAPARRFASPTNVHSRNNSLTSNLTDVLSDAASPPPSVCTPSAFPSEQYEDPSVAVYGDTVGHLSPLVLPSGLGDDSPARWNDVSSITLLFFIVCANFISLAAVQSPRISITRWVVIRLPESIIRTQSLRIASRRELWELYVPFADAGSSYCDKAREYLCWS